MNIFTGYTGHISIDFVLMQFDSLEHLKNHSTFGNKKFTLQEHFALKLTQVIPLLVARFIRLVKNHQLII